ncbi:MAG: hypothetical protein NTW06_04990 [Candidatus Falkowbacteria bacterium]|nr:hypothetical protein [Candidatus Falkowbacteria bacterium]
MEILYLVIIFILSFSFSLIFTFLAKKIAIKLNIIDLPSPVRKIHLVKIPLLGGLGIFLSFFLMLFLVHDKLLAGNLEPHHWLGFFAGACFLMVGGFLDDKYNLKPSQQIIWSLLAGAAVIVGGVQIEKITNPFGGFIFLKYFSPA